ncbi:MAG: YgcG family protein [Leptolyngbyaceae cyanobacterium CRU_2_3]|nr:YgcG family protein [Leptolyngbyaceae cyanobacterium CRU_2_3]
MRRMLQRLSQAVDWKLPFRSLILPLLASVLAIQIWSLGALPAAATGVYSMPNLTAGDPTWLLDQAGVMSRLTQSELNSELADLAKTTGNEVRFVTIHRLDYGETIDTFAEALFKKWFPTATDQAAQVLVVLDNVTNTIAIRTGDAVKDLLPDQVAESVAQETMMVPLRDGNKYNQSFLDASDRLSLVLAGQPDPGPPIVQDTIITEGTFAKAEDTDDRSATVVVVVLLVLATVIPMATYFLYQGFQ